MNTSALARLSDRPQKALKDSCLKFLLAPQTFAVFSMRHVQEAIVLPARQLTPMPNMPPCMLGLMNRRSRVLWVVNLAQLLGLPSPDLARQQYNLVIIQVGAVLLGLAVQKVEGISWIEADAIQSPLGQVAPNIVPYLSGCVWQQQTVVLVLDAPAIVRSPIFQSY
jgi:positive phototaxis protein PixI